MIAARYGGWGAFIISTNDGWETWDTVFADPPRPLPPKLYFMAFPDKELCLVTCDSGIVLRTTNLGMTWDKIMFDKNSIPCRIKMINKYEGILLIDQSDTYNDTMDLRKTEDGGLTWKKINIPEKYKYYTGLNMSYPAKGHIKFRTYHSIYINILISTDDGATWEDYDAPYNCEEMDFVDENYGWSAGRVKIDGKMNHLVYNTTDGGKSWIKQREIYMGDFGLFHVDFFDRNKGIAGGFDGSLIITSNGGKNWERDYLIGEGLVAIAGDVKDIEYVSESTAFILTWDGAIYKNDDLISYISDNIYQTDNSIEIYPNPVSDAAVISYRLNKDAIVTLQIFDAFGRKIKTLVNEFQLVGNHSCVFNRDKLLTGLYFYKMQIGKEIKSGKMLLVE
jgi:photosystem II stability/assembly factor-like uncharacterized protein